MKVLGGYSKSLGAARWASDLRALLGVFVRTGTRPCSVDLHRLHALALLAKTPAVERLFDQTLRSDAVKKAWRFQHPLFTRFGQTQDTYFYQEA